MRYWKAGVIFLIAFLIQPSFLNLINIAGYTPNLLLCLTVIFTFLYDGEYYGPLFGTVFIGPTAIALLIVSALVLLLRSFANVENIISMWVVSVLAFLSYYLINWGLFKIAGSPAGLLYVLSYSIWVICYSMVVITVMYLFMIKKTERYHKDRYFK